MNIDNKWRIVTVDEDTRVDILDSLPFYRAKAVPSVILVKHPGASNLLVIVKSRYPHWMLEDLDYVLISHIKSIDDCNTMVGKNVIIDSTSLNNEGKEILKNVIPFNIINKSNINIK